MSVMFQNELVIVGNSVPGAPQAIDNDGMTWIDVTTYKQYFTNGGAWNELSSIPGGGLTNNLEMTTPLTINQNTGYTYTASEVLGLIILRDMSSNNVDDTLPTGSSIIAAIPNAVVGMTFKVLIYNMSTDEVKNIFDNTGCTFITPTASGDRKIKKQPRG